MTVHDGLMQLMRAKEKASNRVVQRSGGLNSDPLRGYAFVSQLLLKRLVFTRSVCCFDYDSVGRFFSCWYLSIPE